MRPAAGAALPPPPQLIAHRGGAGLAPENTVEAFDRAVKLWRADLIELDVRATADGHCVVIHDPTVDRTTDGAGPVSGHTLASLRDLDAGHRFTPDGGATYPFRGRGVVVPTIDEVLELLPATPLIVELKTADAQAPLLDAIRRHDAYGRVIPAGEHAAFLTLFRDYPGPVSAPSESLRRFWIAHRLHLARLRHPGFDTCQVPETVGSLRLVTPRFIRDLHHHRVQVSVWTVDEPADMGRLLDWGVDGIITNRPDRLARLLHTRIDRPLPPGLESGPHPPAPDPAAPRS